uniref:DNA mismatch repair protein S5 domain-containing protein n=1 Tax=Panagrolaimus davidi TaxID=227884 RepID=A0A914P844_9BILA
MADTNDPSSSKIHGLPEEIVNVICNAQVVTTLAGAARELIDNAIDAGATNIEIRLTENGVDILEIIDNGNGIAEENFEFLAKKHCTSKFRDMSDFDNLNTFGFRGEALNALTTFSKVIITTKTSTAPIATRLTYNLSNIEKNEKTAGKNGTSVQVHGLFQTLPVRRHELIKNSKKEFVKLVNTIQAFAFARPDIKFTCSNVIKGKKNPVLSTPGGKATLRDVISTIFGCRAEKDNLLEIIDTLPDSKIRTQCNITTGGDRQFEVLQIRGYISSTESGLGSHAPDRQFIFINKRHVDYPDAAKVINELYRAHNKNRFALYVLFVTVHPSRVNVNITPDKRTVKLRDEQIFFAKLRASLQNAFTIDKGTYNPIQCSESSSPVPSSPNLQRIWSVKKSMSQAPTVQDEELQVIHVAENETPKIAKEKNERMPSNGFASTLPPNPKNILPKPAKRMPSTTSEMLQATLAITPEPVKKRKTSAANSSRHDSNQSGRDGSHLFKSLWTIPLPDEEDKNNDNEISIIDPDSSSPTIDQRELVQRMHNASQEMNESIYNDGNNDNDVTVVESSSSNANKKKNN